MNQVIAQNNILAELMMFHISYRESAHTLVPARSLANWQNLGLIETYITSFPTATVSFRMLYHPVLHFVITLYCSFLSKSS
jgi:hypothetical protein